MQDFTNKVAVITGAGSGIGRALAVNLANRGCNLALSDINTEGLEQTQALITNENIKVTIDILNVAERENFYVYANNVMDLHGKVNMVFNNAGVTLIDTVENVNYEDFEWIMNINFWGVVHGTKAFLPYLKQADEAHIINISSLFGLIGIPVQAAYNASKFAVRGFTEALKMELSNTNIGVSSVHPGGVKTSIVDNARISEASVKTSREKLQKFFNKQAITTAEDAAEVIMQGIIKNKRRILIGKDARMADRIARWFPNSYEKIMKLESMIK